MVLTYDKNGNIKTLHRNGGFDMEGSLEEMDDLRYTYLGYSNKLIKVTDPTSNTQGFDNGNSGNQNDYTYDLNGNMISDKNKEILTIKYNHLNLPVLIEFPTGKITYRYNAAGIKVEKKVRENDEIITDYMDGFQYLNGELQFISHAEGYINFAQIPGLQEFNKFTYIYNYTDHLGNIRLSYAENPKNLGNIVILEENNYYPFGLLHGGYNKDVKEIDFDDYLHLTNEELQEINETELLTIVPVIKNKYKYKFNGKEWQDELGLNTYDYGWRNYDPAIGRWMNIDPLAENGRRWSPYNYALNNPIYFIDPDGMWVKGAGFWRNITSSDARIHAEDFASENEGTVVKGGNGFSVFYSGDNSSSKAFFPNKDSQVTPSSIATVSALEARNPNGHGALNVDMFELLGMTGVAMVQAGIESTGIDKDDAAIISSVLVTVYDLKGLKVNKVINNVDDLLEAAVKTKKQPRSPSIANREVIGDANKIFKEITRGGIPTTKGAIKVGNKNIKMYNSTKGNGKTIQINENGKINKIRVKTE